jgi:hypothetical protein
VDVIAGFNKLADVDYIRHDSGYEVHPGERAAFTVLVEEHH